MSSRDTRPRAFGNSFPSANAPRSFATTRSRASVSRVTITTFAKLGSGRSGLSDR